MKDTGLGPIWATLGAITFWAASPFLVIRFSGLFSPWLCAALATVIATFLAFCLALSVKSYRKYVFEIRRASLLDWFSVSILSCLGFFFYPWLFFSGLQSSGERPVIAYIINYLWPLIGFFAGAFLNKERVTIESFIGLTFGFLGCLFAISAGIDPKTSLSGNFTLDHITAYGYAGLGAIFYGIFSAGQKWAKRKLTISYVARFLMMLPVAALLYVIGTLYFYSASDVRLANLHDGRWLFLFSYALVFLLGHFFWVVALNSFKGGGEEYVAVFLTPALGTLALVIFPLHSQAQAEHIPILAGVSCVLIGVIFVSYHDRLIEPLTATVLAIYFSLALSLYIQYLTKGTSFISLDETALRININQLILAIFAIFSGFTLNSAIQRNNTIKLNFVEFMSLLGQLRERFEGNSSVCGACDEIRRKAIEEFFSNIDVPSNSQKCLPSKLRGFEAHITDPQQSIELMDASSKLDSLCSAIRYLLDSKISTYEWFILWALSLSMMIITLSIPISKPIESLLNSQSIVSEPWVFWVLRVGLVAALTLTLFAIRDFDHGRPRKLRSFLIRAQRESYSGQNSRLPYVPMYALKVSDEAVGEDIVVETFDSDTKSLIHVDAELRRRQVQSRWPWIEKAVHGFLIALLCLLLFGSPVTIYWISQFLKSVP